MTTTMMNLIMRSRFVSQRLIFFTDVALSVGSTLLTYSLLRFIFPERNNHGSFGILLLSALFFPLCSFGCSAPIRELSAIPLWPNPCVFSAPALWQPSVWDLPRFL